MYERKLATSLTILLCMEIRRPDQMPSNYHPTLKHTRRQLVNLFQHPIIFIIFIRPVVFRKFGVIYQFPLLWHLAPEPWSESTKWAFLAEISIGAAIWIWMWIDAVACDILFVAKDLTARKLLTKIMISQEPVSENIIIISKCISIQPTPPNLRRIFLVYYCKPVHITE